MSSTFLLQMFPVVSYLTLFDVKALKDLVRPLFDKGWHKINCYSIGQCSILLSPSSITGRMKSFLTVDLGQLSIVLSLIGLHMEFIITYLTCFFILKYTIVTKNHSRIIHKYKIQLSYKPIFHITVHRLRFCQRIFGFQ